MARGTRARSRGRGSGDVGDGARQLRWSARARQLGGDRGRAAGRGVHDQQAVHRVEPLGEPGQAAARSECPRRPGRRRRPAASAGPRCARRPRVAPVARACLLTFCSSSETVKYAMPSIAAAGRAVRSTSTVTGTVQRARRRRTAPASETAVGEDGRVDAAGQVPQLLERRSSPRRAPRPPSARRPRGSSASFSLASPRSMASATSRACAPSCRSRSMRRRSAAAVSTTTPAVRLQLDDPGGQPGRPQQPVDHDPVHAGSGRGSTHGVGQHEQQPDAAGDTMISNGVSR